MRKNVSVALVPAACSAPLAQQSPPEDAQQILADLCTVGAFPL